MKNIFVVIFLFVSCTIQAQQKASVVIKASPDKSFRYWMSGVDYLSDYEQGFGMGENAQTDSEGFIGLELSIDKPATLNLSGMNTSLMTVLPVYITPGSRDTITITENAIAFSGTNANYNQCLLQTETFIDYCNLLVIMRPSKEVIWTTRSLPEFTQVLHDKKEKAALFIKNVGVDPLFVDEQLYHMELAERMAFMYKMLFHIPDSVQTDDWKIALTKEMNKPLDSPYFRSFREKLFFLSALSTLDYMAIHGDRQNARYMSVEGFERIAKRLNGPNLECAWATLINDDICAKINNKDIPVLYEKLKEHFPENTYQSYLETGVQANILFHAVKTTGISDEDFHILPCDSSVLSLADAIKPLKGKVVYVDIWATWCVSCRAQFPYITKLKEKTKDLDIAYLYISTDKPKDKDTWEKSIRYYEMKGYHLLASPQLTEALYKEYGNWVPHFMIIDKEGNIVEANAPSPEQMDALYNKLVQYK